MWIGGNSTRAMRRAVESAQGWCPFPNPASAARATKTPKLETVDELADRIGQARVHAASIGRTEPFDICFAPMGLTMFGRGADDGELRAEIQALADLGVTQVPVEVHVDTRVAWLQRAERLANLLMP